MTVGDLDEPDADVLRAATADMETLHTRLVAEAEASDQRRWEAWRDKSLDKGAGLAHKVLRDPSPWISSVNLAGDEVASALPKAILFQMAGAWHKEWKA